jgi:hypothetical protein
MKGSRISISNSNIKRREKLISLFYTSQLNAMKVQQQNSHLQDFRCFCFIVYLIRSESERFCNFLGLIKLIKGKLSLSLRNFLVNNGKFSWPQKDTTFNIFVKVFLIFRNQQTLFHLSISFPFSHLFIVHRSTRFDSMSSIPSSVITHNHSWAFVNEKINQDLFLPFKLKKWKNS